MPSVPLPYPERTSCLWQSRGSSREYGHNLLAVDLLQRDGSEPAGMAHRCDRQDALLPEPGE